MPTTTIPSSHGASIATAGGFAPPQGQKDSVATTSVQFDQMAADWDLVYDLVAGTKRMRVAATKWLPQEPREQQAQYNNRLSRSILFNAVKDTRDKLASKPFAKPIVLKNPERLPGRLQEIQDDADLTGQSLDQFAHAAFTNAVQAGKTHILVDFPSVDVELTREEEESLNLRPTLINVRAEDLFYWASERQPNGEPELTEIRWREVTVEKKGEHGDSVVERVRVMTREAWQVWEFRKQEGEKMEWVLASEGAHTFGAIPLVTIYTRRTGFMTAGSPLEELGWLNLAHWQSQSDQRNILRFARVGIIFASGLTRDELENGLTIGPNSMTGSTNPDANMKYVEHGGKAIGAGRDDLLDLERKMEVLGMQPLVDRANPTVIGQAIGENKNITTLQSWVRALEAGLDEAYAMAAAWTGEEVPDDFAVDVFNDFAVSLRGREELDVLLKARVAGEITQETLLEEYMRRGILSADLDVEEETRKTQEEGAPDEPEGDMFGAGDDEDEEEDED